MILMTHVMTEAALLALLGRARRQVANTPARAPSPREATSAACGDELAIHDAAALREGNLSREGIRRLADHLTRCESCRILIAAIVDDSLRAESTGNHSAGLRAPGPCTRAKQSSSESGIGRRR